MGVSGLRRLLEDVVYEANLPTMAWMHWEEHQRPFRVGIDSSIWLVSVEHISKAYPKADPIKILLHKLFRLLSAPIAPLFVFDGLLRPSHKRGKEIDTRAPVVNERKFRDMATALGFSCWTAPGEAEAELSFLASESRLDAVITEDSDALLFGAPLVLSKPRIRGEKKLPPDDFKIYSLAAIKERYEVDCKGLILVGLMGGADYDTIGIEKCTVGMALAIARFGFGNVLIDGYIKHSPAYFADPFLPAWRKQIKDIFRFNPDQILGKRKYPSVARNVFDNFPDVKVIEMHVRPITSRSHGPKWPGFDRARECASRIRHTAALSEQVFGWREGILLEKLRRNVWLGATIRSLATELIAPGSWDAACRILKLVDGSSESTPGSRSGSGRMTDFFSSSRPTPQTPKKPSRASQPLGLSLHQPTDGCALPPPSDMFRSSQPLLLKITLMRTTQDGRDEFRVVVDPTRFVHEALDGLGIPVGDLKDIVNPLPKPATERLVVEPLEDDGDEEEVALWDGAPIANVEDPFRPFLAWLPAPVVERSHPRLVETFRGKGAPAIPGKDGKTRPSRLASDKGKGKASPPSEEKSTSSVQQSGLSAWLATASRRSREQKAKSVQIVALSSSQPESVSDGESDEESDGGGDEIECLTPLVSRPAGPDSSFLGAAFAAKRPHPSASSSSLSSTHTICPEPKRESSPLRPTPTKIPRIDKTLATPAPIASASSGARTTVVPSSDPFREDDIPYGEIDLSLLSARPVRAGTESARENADDDDGGFDWIALSLSQEARLLGS